MPIFKSNKNGSDIRLDYTVNVDSSLDPTSKNPIQNKVVAEEINTANENISSNSQKIEANKTAIEELTNTVSDVIDNVDVNEMTGATADKDGTSGTVPAPKAGQETHILNGNGTWTSPLDNELIASKFKELDENKSDVVIDKSTGNKVVFTIENGIICAREA